MALVTLRSYRDPIDAELAKTRLESWGIHATIVDQHLASIQWLYSNAIGGVKVLVEQSDLEAAREALLDASGSEPPQTPPERVPAPSRGEACPACGARETRPSRLQRNAAALSLLTNLPLVALQRRWVCAACGHSWRPTTPRRWSASPETLRAEALVHEKRPYPILRIIFATLLGLGILYYVELQIRQAS